MTNKKRLKTAVPAIVFTWLAAALPACGGSSSHGDGGAGDGAQMLLPFACTAGGIAARPDEIKSTAVSLGQVSGQFVAPGSDLTGSITTRSTFRAQIVPASMGSPPHTELSVYLNGC